MPVSRKVTTDLEIDIESSFSWREQRKADCMEYKSYQRKKSVTYSSIMVLEAHSLLNIRNGFCWERLLNPVRQRKESTACGIVLPQWDRLTD